MKYLYACLLFLVGTTVCFGADTTLYGSNHNLLCRKLAIALPVLKIRRHLQRTSYCWSW